MLIVVQVLILSLSLCVNAELHVGFTEVDYYENENNGCLEVVVIRYGMLSEDVVLAVHPMTYQQFNHSLPDLPHLPDPAEYENGRQDFSVAVKRITLQSNLTLEDHKVCIDISSDSIKEANEGFLLVLRVEEEQKSHIANSFTNGGVALGVIMDDDDFPVKFESSSYVFTEGDGQKRTSIALVKDATVETELSLSVSVNIDSTRDNAKSGIDYKIECSDRTSTCVWFEPGIQRVVLPISIIDDNTPEMQEHFELHIAATEDAPSVVVPFGGDHATVNIEDNDVMSVGFAEESYTCSENDQEDCLVCIAIISPEEIKADFYVLFYISSVAGTATAEEDYADQQQSLPLFSISRETCFTVTIHNDSVVEGEESFQLILFPTSSYVLFLERVTTTVTILDDDVVSIGFEQQSYSCRESEPESCVLCIAILSTSPVSDDLHISLLAVTLPNTATPDEDYKDTRATVILSSERQRVCMGVDLWDDSTAEQEEGLLCALSYNDYSYRSVSSLERSVATIMLEDNDVVTVGFEQEEYTCSGSGSETCDVCISFLTSTPLDSTLFLYLSILIISETAKAERHIISMDNVSELSAAQQRLCMPEPIVEGDRVEEGEKYILSLNVLFNSFSNLNLENEVAIVTVWNVGNVNSCLGVDRQMICHENAICHDELESGVYCVCMDGYVGDGFTCTDFNECAEGLDDCDHNIECTTTSSGRDIICGPVASCANTDGSYQCTCSAGYTGDGRTCTDINECVLPGIVECGVNVMCKNTPGSFQCVCNDGYQGDGITCNDIDECETGSDDCDRTEVCTGDSCVRVGMCSNTEGGFQCSCRPGFKGDGHFCSDIDECTQQLHNCDTRALCINTLGGFQCMCKRGYVGNGSNCHPLRPFTPCEKRGWKGDHEDEDTRPLHEGQQKPNSHQNPNTDNYQDSWSWQTNEKSRNTKQDNSATSGPKHKYSHHDHQQQHHHTATHRNKKSQKPRLWLSTWPHPLTDVRSLKESQDHAVTNIPGSQEQSSANSHSAKE